MSDALSGYRDANSLTNWTKRLLFAQVVIAIVALISNWLEYQLLTDFQNGVYDSDELAIAAGEVSDTRQAIVGVLQAITYVVGGVLTLKWIHRANYNARQLGARNMVFTPRWVIGWYFIPIVNLWKPYAAMVEIWRASTSPHTSAAPSTSPYLPFWWFCWIVENIAGNASLRMSLKAESIGDLLATNVVTQIADIITIPLCLIFIVIIRRVHDVQELQARFPHSVTPPQEPTPPSLTPDS